MSKRRQREPAAERNRKVILEVLKEVLPPSGTVLEVSSGTGQHAAFFAPELAPRRWQPSELERALIGSIEAWAERVPEANLFAPVTLDASAPVWPVEETPPDPAITAIVNINMIHIAPWEACLGLLAGAGRILPPGGILYLYGPYRRGGVHTVSSNEDFDQSLQARDPQWGVRDLDEVEEAAKAEGLVLDRVIDMPVNNLSVVFRKSA
jgi:SAM-dependent methyltransferase